MVIVGALLKQFGPTSGGGGGSPPATPILTVTVNGDGTSTATISGSSVGAVNAVYLLGALNNNWTLVGSVTGNGSITFDTSGGRYFAYIISTLNNQSVTSLLITFWVLVEEDALNHSPAEVVRQLIIDLGLGTDPEDSGVWPVFATREHSEPDNIITVYDTSGITQGRIQFTGQTPEHFGIMVRVRSRTHEGGGWAKIHSIKRSFDTLVNRDTVVIGSSVYLVQAISRTGGVLSLGSDSPVSKRVVFTLNVIVSLSQLS